MTMMMMMVVMLSLVDITPMIFTSRYFGVAGQGSPNSPELISMLHDWLPSHLGDLFVRFVTKMIVVIVMTVMTVMIVMNVVIEMALAQIPISTFSHIWVFVRQYGIMFVIIVIIIIIIIIYRKVKVSTLKHV